MAYSPFIFKDSFWAISDFSVSKIKILPFQLSTKSAFLHIWQTSFSTTILQCLHTFFAIFPSHLLVFLFLKVFFFLKRKAYYILFCHFFNPWFLFSFFSY